MFLSQDADYTKPLVTCKTFKNNDDVLNISILLANYHNLNVDSEEIQNLLIIEWNNQQYYRRMIISFGDYSEPVMGGRIIGLVAIAALGFFFLPGLIGVSPLMGALIGASIGWRLFGFSESNKPKQKALTPEKTVSTPGFDSAPQPPQIGSVIPLIFTNKDINPNGGVRVIGNVINSYIKTEKNVQTLLQLTAIGLGEFSRINPNGLLIDSQPRDNFFVDEIKTNYTNGVENQTRFTNFPFYSQAISPSNQNSLGASYKGLINNGSLVSNTFIVSTEDFEGFSPSQVYRLGGVEFKVINKNRNDLKIFTNINLTNQGDRKVYAVYKTVYKTQKKCSRIDLNFAFDIWARDSSNNLTSFAIAFQLWIDNVYVTNLYEVNKREGTIRRALTIQNLSLTKHKIELRPLDSFLAGSAYRLDDSGDFRNVNTGVVIDGKEVVLRIESSPPNQLTLSEINSFLNNDGKSQMSSDRGPNGRLTSVNEIVFPTDINQESMVNYKNLVISETVLEASDRIQNSPSYSHDIEKAIIYRNHIAAGKASPGSSGNLLIGNGIDFSDVQVGYILRNISRQNESLIISFSGFQITTASPLNFSEGDDFLIYFEDSICYFPDLFCYTLISKLGGLGNIVNEKFIDYPSICKSRKFCETNNFFWDGVVDTQTGWDKWVSLESLASLLFPSKFAGNFGLLPEIFEEPKDIYTTARILPGSFSQSYPNSQKINTVQLTYKFNEDGIKKDRTISIMTGDAFYGRENLFIQNLKYDSITNENQAKKIGARFLKSRLIQNKVLVFDVSLSGFNNREGDLIIVQFALTENQSEISGTVISVGNLSGGNQQITISRNIPTYINSNNQKVSIYHRESGTVQTNKNFTILSTNTLLVTGLTEPIKPNREGWGGDIIILTSSITERIYRISSIKPNESSITITCINWEQSIIDDSDLFFIN